MANLGQFLGEVDGVKFYRNAIDANGSVSAGLKIGYISAGGEWDNNGRWQDSSAMSLLPDESPVVLSVDNSGKWQIGGTVGAHNKIFDAGLDGGLVRYADGELGVFFGGEVGVRGLFSTQIGVDFVPRQPGRGDSLATYNTVAVNADGTIVYTSFMTNSDPNIIGGVKARVTHTDRDGNLLKAPEYYGVGEPYGSDMSFGRAKHWDHQCFVSGTLISMADGSLRPIEEIAVGDTVVAFDGQGHLYPRNVVRIFNNVTDELIQLRSGTLVTPGHHFLTTGGRFSSIAEILKSGGVVFDEFNNSLRVEGQLIRYSKETAGLSENVVVERWETSGALALSPVSTLGWKTFNFEVEELHTYIAGGLRVHNDSLSYETLSDALDNKSSFDIYQSNEQSNNSYDSIKSYSYKQDRAVFNTGSNSEIYSQQEKQWRTDLLKQVYMADGSHQWVVQYKDSSGNVVTKDPDTGKRLDTTNITGSDGSSIPVMSKGTPGLSPDGGNHVYIASGKLMQVGQIYSGPDGQSYKVNRDGSMTNQQTSQTINSPSDSPRNTGSSSSQQIGNYNTETGYTDIGGSPAQSLSSPIVFDLDGDGVEVTNANASNVFMDLVGDGFQHRTAWAGIGDGVLVRDSGNDGVINLATEIDFTTWDPTAKSDLQALLNVFDTDHDGKLDSGDADWSLFKVMVTNADGTTTLKTLGQLGITSLDLISNNQEVALADGSKIHGTSVFTRADGTTGRAGDVTLVYESQGYVVTKTVTANADGSTTIVNTGTRPDGSIAHRTTSVASANGLSRATEFDLDGNGVGDRRQVETRVVNANGSTTETLLDYDGESQILERRQVTTRSADGSTVTVEYDETGSNVRFDRVETRVTAASGVQTVTVENRNADNSLHDKFVTVTNGDGLQKTVQTYLTGTGPLNATRSETTSVAGNGTRTETITNFAGNATAAANRIGSTTTTSTSDGSSKTVSSDLDGNGTLDLTATSAILRNANGSTTTTITTTNGNGSARGRSITDLSADGHTKTVRVDLDGNGSDDLISSDVKTFGSNGETTQTVTSRSGNNTLLSSSTSTWSADGKTRSVSLDSNGDGLSDRIQTVAIVGSQSVDTQSVYSPNGSTLLSRSVTTTSADGLIRTKQVDADGNGTNDAVLSLTKVINANGTSSVTEVTKNGAGTADILKTVTTTSADGLQQSVSSFRNGEAQPHTQVSMTKVLNPNGSFTETIVTFSGSNLIQAAKVVATTSADRLTVTTNTFVGSNTAPETVSVLVTAADGSKTETSSGFSPSGATLLGRTVTTTSSDGLTVIARTDSDGDGDYDATSQSTLALNTSGSTTLASAKFAGTGTSSINRVEAATITTSGNGLSVTSLRDVDGDGTNDVRSTDVTTLNSDGSKTKTVATTSASGSLQASKTVGVVSDDGLTKTVTTYFGADATADLVQTEQVTLGANGSTTTTSTSRNANNALTSKRTVVESGDGLTVTKSVDLDGDGDNDVTANTTTLANGSSQTVTSTFDAATGVLQSKTTSVVSGNGMSLTIESDLDGNTTIDRRSTDVTTLNTDGSKTRTVTNFGAANVVEGKTTTTTSGDGLTIATNWEGQGNGLTRNRVETAVTNADGSATKTVSNYKAGSVLNDRTVVTVSADGTTRRETRDIDGNGVVDETTTETHALDGIVRRAFMDGTVSTSAGREFGAGGGKYITTSANALSQTIRYDASGDGLAESETTDVTVLNTNGTKVRTVTNSTLTGGNAASSDPAYTATLRDKAVITTSANGRIVNTQWDMSGTGSFSTSREDTTVIGTDGATTQSLSYRVGATLDTRYQKVSSLDGLAATERWDNDGNGTYDEVANTVIVKNADGSTTRTVTNTASAEQLSNYVITTSADGRTVTSVETVHIDDESTGPIDNDRALIQQKSKVTITLADGSTRVTEETRDGITSTLLDRDVTETSADGRLVTMSRDSNGDSNIDQIKSVTQHVDGSVTTDLTDKVGATVTGRSIMTKSADGRIMTTRQDIDGDGVFDRETDHTWRDYADGSTEEVIASYMVSRRNADGTVVAISRGAASQTTTVTVSADGRTETARVDVLGGDAVDQESVSVTRIDGSTVTTVTSNAIARAVAPLAGNINWKSSVAEDATTAAVTMITTSVDGRDKTVQSDFNGDGIKEHEELWHTAIDGSQRAEIVDKNASGTVIARGIMTVSPDGLVTVLYRDNNVDGTYEYMERAVLRLGGSVDRFTYALEGGAWVLKSSVFAHANGQSLVIEGTEGNDTLVGGDWNDTLRGKGGNDTLDGRNGADQLIGGTGDDTYIVDNGGDIVTEDANSGTDLVKSSVTYTLAANVENLTLTGASTINGTGNSLANVLVGNSASNTLNGGAGADTMIGGTGNDTYVVDNAGDVVTELVSEGADLVQSSITYTLTSNVENLTLTGSAAINGTGNTLSNVITGNSAANILSGAAGNDTLNGGDGNDVLIGGAGADALNGGAGSDTASYETSTSGVTVNTGTPSSNTGDAAGDSYSSIEIMRGSAYDDNIVFIGSGITIYGEDGNDNLIADGLGNTIYGGAGHDLIRARDGTASALAGGNDILDGGSGNDEMYGLGGKDIMIGGTGDDTMMGGADDDTYYVDSVGDVVVENIDPGEGIDLVFSSVTYTLANNVENMTLTGTAAINGTGNTLDNILIGNSAANILNGGGGNDTLSGGGGNDTLNGGTGTDLMSGGIGDDIYVVDNIGDVVAELAAEGTDLVQSSVTYTLGSNVENLTLTGSAAITGRGNELNNTIIGNSGANVLNGGDGNDLLIGGAGADALNGGNGIDTVSYETSSTGLTIKTAAPGSSTGDAAGDTFSSIEILKGTAFDDEIVFVGDGVTLHGGDGNDNLIADGIGNTIYGGSGNDLMRAKDGPDVLNGGNDVLDGGSGNDEMYGLGGNDMMIGGTGDDAMMGGAGNDTYVVDSASDLVVENAGEGTDLVQTTVSYTLADNVENMTLLGSAAINATGNALANVLIGNSAANTLNGAGGADTMSGGGGNDLYIVDNAGDVINELAGEGTDSVQSSVTYTLVSNVENLTLTGSAATNGTGNSLDNVLTGNSAANTLTGGGGNDTLNGGAGADTMVGGTGNDTYVVDNSSDIVTEAASEGTDLVQSSISYVLTSNVENLTLTGSAVLNGTGNSLDNIITGNTGANTLNGGAGNDTLNGGDGNDLLIGGAGADALNGGNGLDTASYEASSVGLYIGNLTPNTNTGDAAGDTYSSIEVIKGTAFDDVISFLGSGLTVYGGDGNDNIIADGLGNTIYGGAGNDVIRARDGTASALAGGNDTLDGGSGNDEMYGLGGKDIMVGGTGNDTMMGGADDDTYYVDSFGDVVVESSGSIEGVDLVVSSVTYTLASNVENLTLIGAATIATGNSLANVLTGNSSANTLYGLAGNDTLDGSDGDDTLYGGQGDDNLFGGNGADTYDGGDGYDTVSFATATSAVSFDFDKNRNTYTGWALNDIFISIEAFVGTDFADTMDITGGGITLYGGAGNDHLNLWWGTDVSFFGEAGDDTLWGDYGMDYLDGGIGNDLIEGYDGNDTLVGGDGNDTLHGGYGDDTMSGDAGDDFLYGGDGNDTMIGGEGKDFFLAGVGSNVIQGGAGDDWVLAGAGADAVDGGDGTDTISYATSSQAITFDTDQSSNSYTGDAFGDSFTSVEVIIGTNFDDTMNIVGGGVTLYGGTGNDHLNIWLGSDVIFFGDAGDDTLWGDYGNDLLDGGTDNDSIRGYWGDDLIIGGDGNDHLEGGAGKDWIVGGEGADTFVFKAGLEEDDVADFEVGIDTLEFFDQGSMNFATLISNAEEQDGNTFLHLDDGGVVVLVGVGMTDLVATDFRFM